MKNFAVKEGHTVALRMEWFNMLNRVNFGLPNRTVFSGNRPDNAARLNHAGNAGLIQELSTTARQMQFGLRYTF